MGLAVWWYITWPCLHDQTDYTTMIQNYSSMTGADGIGASDSSFARCW